LSVPHFSGWKRAPTNRVPSKEDVLRRLTQFLRGLDLAFVNPHQRLEGDVGKIERLGDQIIASGQG